MKESFPIKASAALLAAGAVFGLASCSTHADSKLASCETTWSLQGESNHSEVTNMNTAMADLERGHAQLVEDIQKTLGTDDHEVFVDAIPAQYRTAADLLIGKTNEYWFNTDQSILDMPHGEFCEDTANHTIYKTPAYVNAQAALQVAGINITANKAS